MAVKRGRPGKYETHVLPRLGEVRQLCMTMTDEQIAKTLGIGYTVFKEYKKKHEEFAKALTDGRTDLVGALRGKLIEKGMGFTKTVTKAMKLKHTEYSNGKKISEDEEIVYYTEEQYYAPDVAALNLLLKNYDKMNWANDPQAIMIREKELALRERQIESNEW